MASIGHVAVGMLAARAYGNRPGRSTASRVGSLALWSGLSLLPDADVIGFGFGVLYADEWGHRGATHSVSFALVVGACVALLMKTRGQSFVRAFALASTVVVSHPLLDTLTTGGLGCALGWPFDSGRYFAPWRPIPVAPIGLRFFSPRGLQVALIELALFLPVFALALWPRRRRLDSFE